MKLKIVILSLVAMHVLSFKIDASSEDLSNTKRIYKKWFNAATKGNLKVVQDLLGTVNINAQDGDGNTALILAALNNHENIVSCLIQTSGINVNLRTKEFGMTALMCALPREKTVELLLQSPTINVNIQDSNGNTALMYAIQNWTEEDSINCIKLLLTVPNINIYAKNKMGKNAKEFALERGYHQISPLIQRNQRAFASIEVDDVATLKWITHEIGYNIRDEDGNTLMDKAVENPNRDTFLFLLAQDHSTKYQTKYKKIISKYWFDAIEKADLNLIRSLTGKVDVNLKNQEGSEGSTALIIATSKNYENVVKELLQVPNINVNISSYGMTALMLAIEKGHENIVKLLLLAPDINVNLKTEQGNTALMFAVTPYAWIKKNPKGQSCQENIVKLLLNVPNININIQNKNNKNALTIAIEKNRTEMAQLILDKVEELTRKAFYEMSAYNKASSDSERQKITATLKSIIGQIGLNIVDAEGKTLLDKAFAARNFEIILFLLSRMDDPQEQAANLPFELINPTTDLFKLFMKLAGLKERIKHQKEKHHNKDTDQQICAFCSKINCIKLCAGCKKVYYCSAECQKAHWQNHKSSCKGIR